MIGTGRIFFKAAGAAVVLLSWQLVAVASDTRMLPGLGAIGSHFLELLRTGELIVNAQATLAKGISGLFFAIILGSVAGILCAGNRVADAAIHPLVSALYPIPKLSLYPVVILIFGLGASSKVVQVTLECFFPVFVQMYAGAKAVPRNMMWLAENNEVGHLRLVRDVQLPSMLPYFLTALRISTPIMLLVMCVTEFVGESQGLGYLIVRYSSYFDTASAFAVVFFFGFLGLAADRLIVYARARLVFWESGVNI